MITIMIAAIATLRSVIAGLSKIVAPSIITNMSQARCAEIGAPEMTR